MAQLPWIYGITGAVSILTGPLIGKLSDRFGKLKIFIVGTIIGALMVAIYTQLDATPLWVVIALNIILFAGISARMISSSALVSAIPAPQDRGAFMSINSSVQQVAGGVASAIAGLIVLQTSDGNLHNYDILGYVVIGTMITTVVMMYYINKQVIRMAREAIKPEIMTKVA